MFAIVFDGDPGFPIFVVAEGLDGPSVTDALEEAVDYDYDYAFVVVQDELHPGDVVLGFSGLEAPNPHPMRVLSIKEVQ